MDNNQMNGMQNSVNTNGVGNQVPVDNGAYQAMPQQQMPMNNVIPQQQMSMNNGTPQVIPQQQMPMNNGAPQVIPQQEMSLSNGMPQAMPQQQMPMNNGMSQQQMPGSPSSKKSNTGLIIIIIILGVIILGLAGFIGISLLSGNSTTSSDNPEVEEIESEDEQEDDGNVGQVDNSNTKTITHNGYTYKVDSGIVYKEQNSMLIVGNAAVTVSAQITSAYGSYAQYLASSESLKQQLVSSGYGTITYEPKKYNNRDYMIFSGTYQNMPFQFFVVGLDSTHVMQGLMITKTGNEWSDGYNMIEDFVSDVNGTGSGNTSSSFSVSIPGTNNGTFFQEIK